jgi:hypothetical protein
MGRMSIGKLFILNSQIVRILPEDLQAPVLVVPESIRAFKAPDSKLFSQLKGNSRPSHTLRVADEEITISNMLILIVLLIENRTTRVPSAGTCRNNRCWGAILGCPRTFRHGLSKEKSVQKNSIGKAILYRNRDYDVLYLHLDFWVSGRLDLIPESSGVAGAVTRQSQLQSC